MALGSAYASIGSTQPAPVAAFAAPGFFLPPAIAGANGGTPASKSRQQQQQHQPRQSGWHSSSSSLGCSVNATTRRARALRALNMSGSETGSESGGSAEMPEATKRLLEQAAKIRAEVRD